MKIKYATSFVAAFSLGISGASYAAASNIEMSKSVTVPTLNKGYFVSIDGLHLRSVNDNLNFARRMDVNGEAGNLNHFFNINTKHHYHFRIAAGKNIVGTGNDIVFNWSHIRANDTAFLPHQNNTVTRSRFSFLDNFGIGVYGNTNFRFDEANLQFGQYLKLDALTTRFHGGITAANVKQKLKSNARSTESSGHLSSMTDSRFWGVGIRVGADSAYPISDRVDLVFNFSGALLAGKLKTRTESVLPFSNSKISPRDESYVIVPAADIKLGATWKSQPWSNGHIEIGAGVQATEYLHVISLPAATFINGNGRDVRLIKHYDLSNYGNHGCYLNFKWLGNYT